MIQSARKKYHILVKRLQGVIISTKMINTAVVKVSSPKINKKYHRRYLRMSNYKAENLNNQYQEGDTVVIEAVRPLSRDKRWRIIRRLSDAK